MKVWQTLYGRVGLAAALLCAAALAFYGLGHSSAPPPTGTPQRPNVLLIVWDTVRADRLSCYGYQAPTTTHLDQFAADAALYEYAIAPAMWTVPTHASLFTGLPVTAHGVNAYHKWLNSDYTTLAETYGQAGYDTYFFSTNPRVGTMGNFTQGFDTVEFSWSPRWQDRVIEVIDQKVSPADRSNQLTRWWNQKSRPPARSRELGSAYLKEAGPVAAAALQDWLDRRRSSEPFFAFFNLMEAHHPRIPSPAARGRVMSPEQVDQSYRLDQSHDLQMAHLLGMRLLTDQQLEALNTVYDASLVDLDEATNEIFRLLERRRMLDNTVVAVTSDHGENLGEHGLIEHKFSIYDQLLHVPLIVRFPPRLKIGRITEPVPLLDLYATLLDLSGLQPPALRPHSISLLADPQVRARRQAIISEMIAPTPSTLFRASRQYPDLNWTPWMRWFRAVHLEGLKFIWASDGRHQLYDLGADPEELDNLYPAHPQRAEPLQKALNQWLDSVEPYDHYQQRQDHARPPTPEDLQRLRALGYVQ